MKKLIVLIIMLPLSSWCQSPDQNWMKSTIYRQASTTPLPNPEPLQAQVSTTYFDGLGRPIQQNAFMQSADAKDIITHIEYDEYGRQITRYLPFVAKVSMAFVEDAAAATSAYPDYTAQQPYSKTEFESSPMNRILRQAAPGTTDNWAMGSNHEIRYQYEAYNRDEDAVKWFTALENTIADDGLYDDNTLYKNSVKDENGAITQTFTNLKGQLILKRAFNNGNIDTYYLYDQYENLAYVVPPLATNPTDSEELKNLCYSYKYDSYNRLIEKKEPEKQAQYIIYDKLDRIVATGPVFDPFGQDETKQGWLVTRYDNLNRVAYTGWYKELFTDTSAVTLQSNYNGQIENVTRISETLFGQIPIAYTTLNDQPGEFLLLTINYYDDYNFPAAPTSFTSSTDQVYYSNVVKPMGLPTGTWVRILKPDTDFGKNSYILYDKWARPVVSATDDGNPGAYTTNITTLDDFSGQTLQTEVRHKLTGQVDDLRVSDFYDYTSQGRVAKHFHKILNMNTEILAVNSYSPLGRLTIKETGSVNGDLQHIDYTYNIRGWLTGINNYKDIVTPKDLFAFGINYDKVQDADHFKPQFNGNISETYWRSANDNVLRKYDYGYDGLNRMTSAIYEKNDVVTDSYNEVVRYDNNGNILTMQRNGNQDNMAPPVIEIDDLRYDYKPKSNRLKGVYDDTGSSLGFNENPGAQDGDKDYSYDANGNLTRDDNKGITKIIYNHLNLPTEIFFTNKDKKISYIYTATGEKLQKIVSDMPSGSPGAVLTTTGYKNGFQYTNGQLRYFPTSEGYVAVTQVNGGNKYNYVYNYLDHLGNIRLSYGLDEEGKIKILEENEYYPYGLKHSSYNSDIKAHRKAEIAETVVLKAIQPTAVVKYNYKFNGQEWQDELGLNLYDMDMRDYDPAIGRWTGIDPVTHFDQSTYMAMDGDPVYFADPSGADAAYTVMWQANQAYLNNSIGTSSNWGQSAVGGNATGYINNLSDNAIGFSTNNSSTILSIIGHYALQNGFSRYSFIELDASASGGIGGGFKDYKTSEGSNLTDKYGGLKSYRAWRDYPLYHKGETWFDKFARNVNSSHMDIMLDYGGGGYNMFGGYGRAAGAAASASATVESEIVQATTRVGKNGNAVEIVYQNGDIIDINVARVKMRTPNLHPKAPSGATNPVKFDPFLPGSKGLKRTPTSSEIELLNSFFK